MASIGLGNVLLRGMVEISLADINTVIGFAKKFQK